MIVAVTTDDASSFDAFQVSINTGAPWYTFSEAAILMAVVVIVNATRNIMRNEGGGRGGGEEGLYTKLIEYLSKCLSHFCFTVVQKRVGASVGSYVI